MDIIKIEVSQSTLSAQRWFDVHVAYYTPGRMYRFYRFSDTDWSAIMESNQLNFQNAKALHHDDIPFKILEEVRDKYAFEHPELTKKEFLDQNYHVQDTRVFTNLYSIKLCGNNGKVLFVDFHKTKYIVYSVKPGCSPQEVHPKIIPQDIYDEIYKRYKYIQPGVAYKSMTTSCSGTITKRWVSGTKLDQAIYKVDRKMFAIKVESESKPKDGDSALNHIGHEIVDSHAAGKSFKYCRTCKIEVK